MSLTPKQENFAQEVVRGRNLSDAYRASYNCKNTADKTINENASRLMADSKVSARVDELRQKVENKVIQELVYTAKESFDKLCQLQDLALTQEKPEINNAIKSEELKGRLAKLYEEQNKTTILGIEKALVEFK